MWLRIHALYPHAESYFSEHLHEHSFESARMLMKKGRLLEISLSCHHPDVKHSECVCMPKQSSCQRNIFLVTWRTHTLLNLPTAKAICHLALASLSYCQIDVEECFQFPECNSTAASCRRYLSVSLAIVLSDPVHSSSLRPILSPASLFSLSIRFHYSARHTPWCLCVAARVSEYLSALGLRNPLVSGPLSVKTAYFVSPSRCIVPQGPLLVRMRAAMLPNILAYVEQEKGGSSDDAVTLFEALEEDR